MKLFCRQDHSQTIQRLHLEPDDTLIVKCALRFTSEHAQTIKEQLAAGGITNNIIVIPEALSLSVMSNHTRTIAT